MPIRRLLPFALLALTATTPLAAQDKEDGVPYWASLRGKQVNLRVGPGEDYRIAWVYKRELLPMKVLRTMEGWRLVEDPDGARGWMLARFLTRTRGAIVKGKTNAEMRDGGDASARLLWKLEPGVTGKLGDCASGWCAFEVGPHRGFVSQSAVWGAGEP